MYPRASRFAFVALFVGTAACGSSSPRSGFENAAGTPDPAATTPAAPGATGDFNTMNPAPPAVNPSDINEVWGHSSDTLFSLDPVTKAVTEIGKFNGCEPVVDIALDEASNLFATSNTALYSVDKKSAVCTEISTGTYPNSLSFVPKGTVDPNLEALVGYEGDKYVRIDTKTGAKSTIGTLGGGLQSSGDIVSVKGGKTYLTVKSTSGKTCATNDCLVEVDPASGAMVKNWGSIEHHNVFGLSFWGGKLYGFDDSGELFEVTFGTSQLATSVIAMPNKPSGLSFWGAGSSTSAPLVAPTK
ncbi:MAG: hypothetical protein JWO86_1128 [Myxococcaceae bacterium]|nr:hypothetical protein [Myxococcaceae bacterium]